MQGPSRLAASFRTSSLVMLYRSNTERVLCPLIFMATVSGTPALTHQITYPGSPQIMEENP